MRQIFNESVPALLRNRVIRLDSTGINVFGAFLGRVKFHGEYRSVSLLGRSQYSTGFRSITNLQLDNYVTWRIEDSSDEIDPNDEY
jgi:hypothetical protein